MQDVTFLSPFSPPSLNLEAPRIVSKSPKPVLITSSIMPSFFIIKRVTNVKAWTDPFKKALAAKFEFFENPAHIKQDLMLVLAQYCHLKLMADDDEDRFH